MNAQTKQKISAAQRHNWETRRAATEQLEALRQSHRRVLETLDHCAAFVDYRAEEGDTLARFLKAKLDAAFDSMNAEGIGARTLITDTSQLDTERAPG
ncbi:MAG: hypothetical protein M3360_05965 [Actinomycetota bacterium]|nr:hypothetical protein [Actinomycetota bacterium]